LTTDFSVPGANPANVDLKGNRRNRSPKFTVSANADYDIPLSGAMAFNIPLRGEDFHSSAYFLPTVIRPGDRQGQYTLLYFSATISGENDKRSRRLFVKNAANKAVKSQLLFAGMFGGAYLGNCDPRAPAGPNSAFTID
jgi:hypothetical protein